MQATKLIKIVVLLCIILHSSQVAVFGQEISWMKGLWKEERGMPYQVPPVKCINNLMITTIADSTFTGLQTTFFADDTSIRVTYACNGMLSRSSKYFKRGNIVYKKNSQYKGFEWNSCGNCDTRTCSLYVKYDKIFLMVTTKSCDSTCNGAITYYRDLNDFDTLTKQQLTKLYYNNNEYSSMLVSYTERNTQSKGANLPDQNATSASNLLLNNDALPPVLKERTNKLAQTLQISSPYIEVILLDDAEIDGDIISLYDNNKEVISHKTLGKEVIKYSIKANKQNAYHEIILVAENLGSIPPNTALMRIRAGEKKYELTTRANMHENAKVVIEYTGE
jgi:hypothetical protein